MNIAIATETPVEFRITNVKNTKAAEQYKVFVRTIQIISGTRAIKQENKDVAL